MTSQLFYNNTFKEYSGNEIPTKTLHFILKNVLLVKFYHGDAMKFVRNAENIRSRDLVNTY